MADVRLLDFGGARGRFLHLGGVESDGVLLGDRPAFGSIPRPAFEDTCDEYKTFPQ